MAPHKTVIITPVGVCSVAVFVKSLVCVHKQESYMVKISMLLLDETMLSPITRFKKSFSFNYDTVRKYKVGCVSTKLLILNPHRLVFEVYPLPLKGEGSISFELGPKTGHSRNYSFLRLSHC